MVPEKLEPFPYNFFVKQLLYELRLIYTKRSVEELTLIKVSNLKLSTLQNALHHGCFHVLRKVLVQLISEHIKKDGSSVQKKDSNKDLFVGNLGI